MVKLKLLSQWLNSINLQSSAHRFDHPGCRPSNIVGDKRLCKINTMSPKIKKSIVRKQIEYWVERYKRREDTHTQQLPITFSIYVQEQ